MPRVLLLVMALVGLSPIPGGAQAPSALPPASTIAFPPGQTLVTVAGEVALGGTQLYWVEAKAGQTMLVSVSSDAEVTFQVFPPEVRLAKGADGKPLIQGKALPDAGPEDNARAWVGALPRSGRYLVAVSLPETGAVIGRFDLTASLQ